MRLTTAAVDRYGPLADCRPPPGDGVTVLAGPNEAGKTLYLEALVQLLEPGVADLLTPAPRVDAAPSGRVVVEHRGERFECDGDTALSGFSPIEPSHLQSVFVVRDGDLALPGERAYYTSLVETLGEVHTSEIDAITAALKDRGRLTDARLDVSSDRDHDHAGDVRDGAAALAADLRAYADRMADEGLDALDAERLRTRRQLRDAREALATQRAAKAVAEHERLADALDTYRETSERLADLAAFDRETLDELRELDTRLQRDREDLAALDEEIEETAADRRAAERALDDLEAELAALERRAPAVDAVRDAIERFRDRQAAAAGTERRLQLTRPATAAGLLGSGAAGAAAAVTGSLPAVGVAVLLLAVAVGSAVGHYRSTRRLSAVESARTGVLQAARDAGFEVESVGDVAPAVEAFDGELSRIRERVARTDQERETAADALETRRAERAEVERRIAEGEERLSAALDDAGVESLDGYASRVETREGLEPERRSAGRRLAERFGEPDADDPAGAAAAWAASLDDIVADVDCAVAAAEFDPERLADLEDSVDRLEAQLAELQGRLDDHDARLDRFDRRARDLGTEPFVDRTLGLDTRSAEGVAGLADDLEAVVERIETDAELSRKALELFGEIAAAEEQKLADLFRPDGPASRTFERLTGGRYETVAYDADAHELEVERRDGRRLAPESLSQGTRDQLYFATRVSLASQLLGSEPGFLLLDDPFVAADADRLRNGFETLCELADDGWQIVYCTAKREVGERMVEAFDLRRVELDAGLSG